MDTATEERPPTPAAGRRAVRPVVLALVATALVAGMALVAWGARESSSVSGELKAAFPDISDPAWKCSSEGLPSGGYLYSCAPSSGAEGPTLNIQALAEPETMEDLVAGVEDSHREAERQNHSGFPTEMTFLGTEDWSPDDDGEVWGGVARWRFVNTQVGEIIFRATYRYADKPFGVTVYASSLAELEDVVAGLHLPAPADLPG